MVLLPEPDGPTIAVVLPGSKVEAHPVEHRRTGAVVTEITSSNSMRGAAAPASLAAPGDSPAVRSSTERMLSSVARVLSSAGPSSLIG